MTDKTRALEIAAYNVDKTTKTWKLLDENAEERVPRFDMSEFKIGRVLGRGGFCVVSEISAVTLKGKNIESSTGIEEDRPDVIQDRNFIAKRCIRNGDARYCLKIISEETFDDTDRYIKGVIDLVIEFKMLAVLHHPNIIKMRATAEGNPFRRDNFIVLDRLYDTMTKRIVNWRKEAEKPWNKFKKKSNKLFMNRLLVAYDLGSAFSYLHQKNIVYRDIKPDNIGFDVRGDVKLFDFGLSKELPPRENELDDTLYNLSAETGSLRYMAPEVATGKPYNLKCDVYSFGILLWEMVSLKTPFAGYNVRMHKKMVIDSNARPKIESKWPRGVQFILSNSWCVKIEQRLTFEEVNNCLRDQIYDDENLDTTMMDCSSKTARSLQGSTGSS